MTTSTRPAVLETGMTSETPTREERVDTTLDDGDHDRFAHFARKADITESAVTGRPVVALCGKVWVPSRNPDRYQVCTACKDIFDRRRAAERGA